MMDTKRLEEIKACHGAATEGPWRTYGHYSFGAYNDGHLTDVDHPSYPYLSKLPVNRCSSCVKEDGPCPIVLPQGMDGWRVPLHGRWFVPKRLRGDQSKSDELWRNVYSDATYGKIVGGYDYEDGGVASTEADAVFIANSWQYVKDLINEVERLRKIVVPVEAYSASILSEDGFKRYCDKCSSEDKKDCLGYRQFETVCLVCSCDCHNAMVLKV